MAQGELAGHTAVVVHGASELGIAIASALARVGADLVLMDADPDVGTVASRLRSDLGVPAMGARGDATDPHFVKTAFRAAIEHLDFPDLVVCAGDGDASVVLEAFAERLIVSNKPGTAVLVVAGDAGAMRTKGLMSVVEVSGAQEDVVREVLSHCLPTSATH